MNKKSFFFEKEFKMSQKKIQEKQNKTKPHSILNFKTFTNEKKLFLKL